MSKNKIEKLKHKHGKEIRSLTKRIIEIEKRSTRFVDILAEDQESCHAIEKYITAMNQKMNDLEHKVNKNNTNIHARLEGVVRLIRKKTKREKSEEPTKTEKKEQKGKHISNFANGDVIVRVIQSNSNDGSWIGAPLKLVRIANGVIELKFIRKQENHIFNSEGLELPFYEWNNGWAEYIK